MPATTDQTPSQSAEDDLSVSSPAEEIFGDYVRSLRKIKNIGQRELARNLGISPSYVNDIELNKRVAPRAEIVRGISEILGADNEKLFDLAGHSRGDIPPDMADIIQRRPSVISLLRTIHAFGLKDDEIGQIERTMTSSAAKVIIIAAGMGSRLKHYTENLPKCLLKFGGKSLLEMQIEAYNNCGINNISVVRGYKKDKIGIPNLKYFDNQNYENNNILNSLFYAEEEIKDHVVISYSDIIFEDQIVKRLLQSDHDISVVVDIDWRGYYINRKDHPVDEAESVIFDANNAVVEIGKIQPQRHDVHGEFIGMMKLSPRGAEVFKRHFHRAKELYWDKPFQRAAIFQKAYLTDMIQEMTDLGVSIHCVIVERGWKEIDTVEDYEKALKDFEE